jgi:hypothetical protein
VGERPTGEGKRNWAAAGTKTEAGPSSSNKTFLNFYLEFELFCNFGNLYKEILKEFWHENFS